MGYHLGHPPVHGIAGTYRHRGAGASRRVPYGGADPGLCCRAWIAGGSVTEWPTGNHYLPRGSVPQDRVPFKLDRPVGLSRTAPCPPSSWRTRSAHTGPGPSDALPRSSTGGVLIRVGPGPLPTSPQAGALTGLCPDPTAGLGPGPGPGGLPPLPTTRTKPPILATFRNPVMRFMLHDHWHFRLPAAHPGLVPPLRILHKGVNHVDNVSFAGAAPTLAPFFQPCSLRTLPTPPLCLVC
jgi:hypothetical protein